MADHPDATPAHREISRLENAIDKVVVSDSLTDLLAAPVVDELHLIVGPVVLGGGTPAFGSASAAPLRLLGTHTWRDSGTVLIRYAATDRAE